MLPCIRCEICCRQKNGNKTKSAAKPICKVAPGCPGRAGHRRCGAAASSQALSRRGFARELLVCRFPLAFPAQKRERKTNCWHAAHRSNGRADGAARTPAQPSSPREPVTAELQLWLGPDIHRVLWHNSAGFSKRASFDLCLHTSGGAAQLLPGRGRMLSHAARWRGSGNSACCTETNNVKIYRLVSAIFLKRAPHSPALPTARWLGCCTSHPASPHAENGPQSRQQHGLLLRASAHAFILGKTW